MNIKLLFSVLFFATLSFTTQAQCSSHTKQANSKHVKAVYHERHGDIIDIASGDDRFSTLTAAIKVAGLAGTLQGDGPFTVFAPTNTAFAKLPAGTVESLLNAPSKDQLAKILTYHVVAGQFYAKDVIAAIKASGGTFSIKTVSGGTLKATLSGDSVILTDEKGGISAITATDVPASNGVIHVIDSVVLPR